METIADQLASAPAESSLLLTIGRIEEQLQQLREREASLSRKSSKHGAKEQQRSRDQQVALVIENLSLLAVQEPHFQSVIKACLADIKQAYLSTAEADIRRVLFAVEKGICRAEDIATHTRIPAAQAYQCLKRLAAARLILCVKLRRRKMWQPKRVVWGKYLFWPRD